MIEFFSFVCMHWKNWNGLFIITNCFEIFILSWFESLLIGFFFLIWVQKRFLVCFWLFAGIFWLKWSRMEFWRLQLTWIIFASFEVFPFLLNENKKIQFGCVQAFLKIWGSFIFYFLFWISNVFVWNFQFRWFFLSKCSLICFCFQTVFL